MNYELKKKYPLEGKKGFYYCYKDSEYSKNIYVSLYDKDNNSVHNTMAYSEYYDKHYTKKEIEEKFKDYVAKYKTFEQAIIIMADWWAEKSFNTVLNQNNGDKSSAGGFGFALMNMISMEGQQNASPEKIEKFKSKLIELMSTEEFKHRRIIDVDYHAYGILKEACDYAELNDMCCPIKTTTRIERHSNVIFTSFGYHGEYIYL